VAADTHPADYTGTFLAIFSMRLRPRQAVNICHRLRPIRWGAPRHLLRDPRPILKSRSRLSSMLT